MILVLLLLFIFILVYYCYITYLDLYVRTEEISNTDWSDDWTPLDFKARENIDCRPITKVYENLGSNNAWIYTVPSSCENGLPHTRDYNVIAIPNGSSILDRPRVIRHEKIHLNQRLYLNKWKDFYKTYWDYELFKTLPINVPMPPDLIKMKRANPDTKGVSFCRWKKKWWTIPVYKDINDLKFENCIIKWWNEETNEILLDPPKEWTDFFGTFSNDKETEHPHEISATYLERVNNKHDKMSLGQVILFKMWDNKIEMLNSCKSCNNISTNKSN